MTHGGNVLFCSADFVASRAAGLDEEFQMKDRDGGLNCLAYSMRGSRHSSCPTVAGPSDYANESGFLRTGVKQYSVPFSAIRSVYFFLFFDACI